MTFFWFWNIHFPRKEWIVLVCGSKCMTQSVSLYLIFDSLEIIFNMTILLLQTNKQKWCKPFWKHFAQNVWRHVSTNVRWSRDIFAKHPKHRTQSNLLMNSSICFRSDCILMTDWIKCLNHDLWTNQKLSLCIPLIPLWRFVNVSTPNLNGEGCTLSVVDT